jgi:hypothetical protein
MFSFISNSNIPGNHGQVITCSGQIFVTRSSTRRILLCSNTDTYSQELVFRTGVLPLFAPVGVANQTNKFPGTEVDTIKESQLLYSTQPMRISGLLSYGKVVSTATKEPLILYYTYVNDNFRLSLYNFKDKTTISILQKTATNINNIDGCNFLLGSFVSTDQHDVYISCQLLGINNKFLIQNKNLAQEVNYKTVDLGLGSWCSNSNMVKLGDFNGDQLSDLFCANTGSAMINKKWSFTQVSLITTLPGNWNNQLTNNLFAIGDFDGDGLSDLASLADNGKPQILFRTSFNNFISRSDNSDGSFNFNNINNWCQLNSTAAFLHAGDMNYDGKDDIICSDGSNTYLALSQANATAPLLKKIVVELNDFNIGNNIQYRITKNNAPLICDSSQIYEYNTKLSCMVKSPNKVNTITLPVNPNRNLLELQVNSDISGSVYLDSSKYGTINKNEDQLKELNKNRSFPKAKLWQFDNIDYNDPTRYFNTKLNTLYVRQTLAGNIYNHFIDQSYGYKTDGSSCYQIEVNHIVLNNAFTANGKMKAYDSTNTQIRDTNLLQAIANLYISGTQIENPADGIVKFTYSGEMELQTLYQRNVTRCAKKNINTANDAPIIETENHGGFCHLQSKKPQMNVSESIISRFDTKELNGYICAGAKFYPNMTQVTTWSNYSQSIDDVTVTQNFGDIQLKAYVLAFSSEPKNELRIQFIKDNQVIYEPTGPNTLYTAFSNIKFIKFAAFSPKRAILSWSIYHQAENQYYILVDYVNTANNLLKIASYDQYFSLLLPTQRYGDEFFIVYKIDTNKIAISKYNAADFSPSASITLDFSSESNTQYQIYENEGYIQISVTHGNNKGIFVYTYDVFLNKIDDANLICPIQNIETLPTKVDEAPMSLKLSYNHNNRAINPTLDQKINLQNALNFIYNGLEQIKVILKDQSITTQVSSALSSLVCPNILNYNNLQLTIDNLRKLLESDLTFQWAQGIKCITDSNYYPIYKEGNIIYLCSGYNNVNSVTECQNLLDIAKQTRGLLEPDIIAKTPTLIQYLTYFPSSVVDTVRRIVNGEDVSEGDKENICTSASYGSATLYVQKLANNIVASIFASTVQQSIQGISACNAMTVRNCGSSTDNQNNPVCLSNFIEASSLAYLVTQSAKTNDDNRFNCQDACDYRSDALNNLLSSVGGYLTTLDTSNLFPLMSSTTTIQTNSIDSTNNNSTLLEGMNVPLSNNIITAVPIYFTQNNASMITWVTLGNDYMALSLQYYYADNTPLSPEIEIGRFLNIKQVNAIAFNESAFIIAYSIKQPTSQNYNIFIEYLSPTISKVKNIVSSYNGMFGICTVPVSDTSTQVMIAYASSNNFITIERYGITASAIQKQMATVSAISEISTTDQLSIAVNAFLQTGFNVVWSYLDNQGTYIQRYNNDGSYLGNMHNIQSQPNILRVGSEKIDKTVISWQTASTIYIQIYSQSQGVTNYNQLKFQSGNYSLVRASVLDGIKNIISLDMIDNNNQTKTIIADAGSNQLLNINFVTNKNNQASVSSSATLASLDNNNANTIPQNDITGKIKNIQINEPQCASGNLNQNIPNVENILDKNQGILKNKPKILPQIQSLLSNTKVLESLKKLGIKPEAIYSLVNSANSIDDIIVGLKNLNQFQNIDLNFVPDTDVSQQLTRVQSFAQNLEDQMSSSGSEDGPINELEIIKNLLIQLLTGLGVSNELAHNLLDPIFNTIESFINLDIPDSNDEEVWIEFVATTIKNILIQSVHTIAPVIETAISQLIDVFQELIGSVKENEFQEL